MRYARLFFAGIKKCRSSFFSSLPTCQVALHQPRGLVKWPCLILSFPKLCYVINYDMPVRLVEYVDALRCQNKKDARTHTHARTHAHTHTHTLAGDEGTEARACWLKVAGHEDQEARTVW